MVADFRVAWRLLWQTPSLTAVALLCLALAIGVTTAAFTVVHGALLAPLPVPDGDRLVMAHEYDRTGRFNVPVSAARFSVFRARASAFDDLGAWYTRMVTLRARDRGSEPAIVRAAYVSPNALDILAIAPHVGRLPVAADTAAGTIPVVVLSHAIWSGTFGGDAGVLERLIDVAGQPHRVVGVMPAGVAFPVREDLWIPIATDPAASNATSEGLTMFGTLRHGVSRQAAEAEMAVLMAQDDPARDPARAAIPVVMPFSRGFMSPEQVWAIWAFLAALLAFVAIIAANVANLFLARNAARAREIAMRAALGASRGRLTVQLLVEALVLGAAAAIAGIGVARIALWWVRATVDDLPWWADFGVSGPVLLFVALTTLMASVVAGIGPAVRLTRQSLTSSLSAAAAAFHGMRFSRAGALLLVVQLAVGVGFLGVVASLARGLFAFSYDRYALDGDRVVVAQVYLGAPAADALAAPGADRREVFRRHYDRSYEQIVRMTQQLAALPGVRHATYATLYPGNDVETARIDIAAPGVPVPAVTRIAEIGPGFFETLGAAVIRGRDFGPADRRGPLQSAIVNAPFADKHFPGQEAIGRTVRLAGDPNAPGPWLEIIGIVPDLGLNPGDEGRADGIYLPFQPSNFTRLAVRTDGDIAALIPRLHDIVRREQPAAQVQYAHTLQAQMDATQNVFRGLGVGLMVIGFTALLLSAVSFYSLIAFSVTRRTREIGVRVALGATRAGVVWNVLAPGLLVIGAGAGAGVLLGAGLYQLVTMIPFDLRPAGPAMSWAVALLLIVGIAACVLPARRAASIAPAVALRHE